MAVKVKIIDKGWKRIQQDIKNLDNSSTKVGFPSNENAAPGSNNYKDVVIMTPSGNSLPDSEFDLTIQEILIKYGSSFEIILMTGG